MSTKQTILQAQDDESRWHLWECADVDVWECEGGASPNGTLYLTITTAHFEFSGEVPKKLVELIRGKKGA